MTKEEGSGGDRVRESGLHKARMDHMCACMGVHECVLFGPVNVCMHATSKLNVEKRVFEKKRKKTDAIEEGQNINEQV